MALINKKYVQTVHKQLPTKKQQHARIIPLHITGMRRNLVDVSELDLTLNSNTFILTEVTSIFKLVKQVVNESHLVGQDKF